MTSAWVSVFAVVLVLAMVPVGLKWLQSRVGASVAGAAGAARVVSAIAVGPHQRVVTIEVGPENARVWLTLGVTAQTINCLHTAVVSVGDLAQAEAAVVTTKAPVQNLEIMTKERQI